MEVQRGMSRRVRSGAGARRVRIDMRYMWSAIDSPFVEAAVGVLAGFLWKLGGRGKMGGCDGVVFRAFFEVGCVVRTRDGETAPAFTGGCL